MTSFQDAPDEAIKADEAKEACSRLDLVYQEKNKFNKSLLKDRRRVTYMPVYLSKQDATINILL